MQAGWHYATPILTNGAAIFTSPCTSYHEMFIDVNGADPPNIYGLDAFIARLYYKDLPDKNDADKIVVKAGTITGYPEGYEPEGKLSGLCEAGNATACYTLAESHNFDYDYLKKAKEADE